MSSELWGLAHRVAADGEELLRSHLTNHASQTHTHTHFSVDTVKIACLLTNDKCTSTNTHTCAQEHSWSLSSAPQLYRHHWSIANTLPGIDCTFSNYICSGCHCRATVKYLSRGRSEATGRSHVSSGPTTTTQETENINPLPLLDKRCGEMSTREYPEQNLSFYVKIHFWWRCVRKRV